MNNHTHPILNKEKTEHTHQHIVNPLRGPSPTSFVNGGKRSSQNRLEWANEKYAKKEGDFKNREMKLFTDFQHPLYTKMISMIKYEFFVTVEIQNAIDHYCLYFGVNVAIDPYVTPKRVHHTKYLYSSNTLIPNSNLHRLVNGEWEGKESGRFWRLDVGDTKTGDRMNEEWVGGQGSGHTLCLRVIPTPGWGPWNMRDSYQNAWRVAGGA